MTGGGPDALVVRRVIRASREEIFDMWTEADNLRLWMRPPRALGASAESDARVGGRYRIVMHGDRDYDRRYGSRDEYKREYRSAFERGYREGFSGGGGWRR